MNVLLEIALSSTSIVVATLAARSSYLGSRIVRRQAEMSRRRNAVAALVRSLESGDGSTENGGGRR